MRLCSVQSMLHSEAVLRMCLFGCQYAAYTIVTIVLSHCLESSISNRPRWLRSSLNKETPKCDSNHWSKQRCLENRALRTDDIPLIQDARFSKASPFWDRVQEIIDQLPKATYRQTRLTRLAKKRLFRYCLQQYQTRTGATRQNGRKKRRFIRNCQDYNWKKTRKAMCEKTLRIWRQPRNKLRNEIPRRYLLKCYQLIKRPQIHGIGAPEGLRDSSTGEKDPYELPRILYLAFTLSEYRITPVTRHLAAERGADDPQRAIEDPCYQHRDGSATKGGGFCRLEVEFCICGQDEDYRTNAPLECKHMGERCQCATKQGSVTGNYEYVMYDEQCYHTIARGTGCHRMVIVVTDPHFIKKIWKETLVSFTIKIGGVKFPRNIFTRHKFEWLRQDALTTNITADGGFLRQNYIDEEGADHKPFEYCQFAWFSTRLLISDIAPTVGELVKVDQTAAEIPDWLTIGLTISSYKLDPVSEDHAFNVLGLSRNNFPLIPCKLYKRDRWFLEGRAYNYGTGFCRMPIKFCICWKPYGEGNCDCATAIGPRWNEHTAWNTSELWNAECINFHEYGEGCFRAVFTLTNPQTIASLWGAKTATLFFYIADQYGGTDYEYKHTPWQSALPLTSQEFQWTVSCKEMGLHDVSVVGDTVKPYILCDKIHYVGSVVISSAAVRTPPPNVDNSYAMPSTLQVAFTVSQAEIIKYECTWHPYNLTSHNCFLMSESETGSDRGTCRIPLNVCIYEWCRDVEGPEYSSLDSWTASHRCATTITKGRGCFRAVFNFTNQEDISRLWNRAKAPVKVKVNGKPANLAKVELERPFTFNENNVYEYSWGTDCYYLYEFNKIFSPHPVAPPNRKREEPFCHRIFFKARVIYSSLHYKVPGLVNIQ